MADDLIAINGRTARDDMDFADSARRCGQVLRCKPGSRAKKKAATVMQAIQQPQHPTQNRLIGSPQTTSGNQGSPYSQRQQQQQFGTPTYINQKGGRGVQRDAQALQGQDNAQ
jgi:hypothetical protein